MIWFWNISAIVKVYIRNVNIMMNFYERADIEVPDGIIHSNVEYLNKRIYNRVIPDNNVKLNPVFDIRSVPTRNWLIFSVIDFDTSIKKSKNDTHYWIEENFAPIQTKGPVSK